MSATYELYEDSAGERRWRLVSRNGSVIADGSEGYSSKSGAEGYSSRSAARDAIARVQRDGSTGDVEEQDN